jgi:hypothetical protein
MRYFFAFITALFFACSLEAQVGVHLNLNLGSQPIWGPTGNDYVENYYLPDIEAYYNVPQHRFYYNEGGRWISRASLPARFHYDLYNSHKVVVNEREPWLNHATYRDKYASFKGAHDQQPIRDSHDSKYFVNAKHPEHNNWVKQQKHDNGKHIGQNKGNNGKGKGSGGNKNNKEDKHDKR